MNNNTKHILLIIAISLVWLFIRFPDFWSTPNTKVLEPWGDGIKAYTVIAYHAKYDSSYHWFDGMYYPYGEHAIPGATQPLLSNTIRFISRNIVDITPWSIGIINWSLMIGNILAILFLFLIFRKLKLPAWYAMLVAFGVGILAPQFERTISHYGLAHVETLPIAFYALLWYEERPSYLRAAVIGIPLLLFSLIHFYFFAILSALILGWFGLRFLRRSVTWNDRLQSILSGSLAVAWPLLFFSWWLFSLDPLTDRTKVPWGFFYYHAEPQGLLYAPYMPFFKLIEWLGNFEFNNHWNIEQKSYLGMVALIGILVLLGRWIKNKFQTRFIDTNQPLYDRFCIEMVILGVLILLFSMGLPFTIKGFEGLLDYAGPIRQFRSIGRFAWIAYYAFNIVVFYQLYHWSNNRRWVVIIPLLILFQEALVFSWNFDLRLDEIHGITYNTPDKWEEINFDDYQAITPIPWYMIGADNIAWNPAGYVSQVPNVLSYQTGLPITAAQLTRTSLSQTFNQMQLVTEPYRAPVSLDVNDNDKPFLLARVRYEEEKQERNFDFLFEDADSLCEKKSVSYYSLSKQSYYSRIENRKQQIKEELALEDSIFIKKNNFRSTDSLWVTQNWDDNISSQKQYIGKGGFEGIMKEGNVVYYDYMPGQDTCEYTLSMWMYANQDLYPHSLISIWEEKNDTEAMRHYQSSTASLMNFAIDSNGWVLLEIKLKPKWQNSNFKVTLWNEYHLVRNAPLWIDQLLIRKSDQDVYYEDNKWIMKNNRWFETTK